MGGVGGAKTGMAKRRSMGVTVLMVVAATMILMSAPAGQAIGLFNVCMITEKSIEINPYDTVYLHTSAAFVVVTMESEGCVNKTRYLLSRDTKTPKQATMTLFAFNWDWHEFTFISCGKYIAKFGSKIVYFQTSVPPDCLSKSTTLKVGSHVVLGRKCSGPQNKVEQSKAECKKLEQETSRLANFSRLDSVFDLFRKELRDANKPTSLRPLPDDLPDPAEPVGNTLHNRRTFPTPKLFGNKHNSNEPEMDDSETILKEPDVDDSEKFLKVPEVNDDFLSWPNNKDILANPVTPPPYNSDDDFFLNDHPGYTVHRKYKENAIPIFIGIVALTVSMCLRFCLCRGKSVVRRVTTVTVIRSRPVGSDAPQDQQDPPPSYVDVVNEVTSPEGSSDGATEPPPPAYADIVDEVQPPTYSEVEAQSMPASEMLPLAEQDTGAQQSQPQPDSESGSDDKGSGATKNMLSKYRHQQKQFAFKVLEED